MRRREREWEEDVDRERVAEPAMAPRTGVYYYDYT